MAKHASEAKAKNPEVFGKMEKAVAICQDKLGAALRAFNGATTMLKDNANNISAAVVAKVGQAYGECAHLLHEGKKAFDDAVTEAKTHFPEMFTSSSSSSETTATDADALSVSSNSLEEASKAIEDAVASEDEKQ